MNQLNSFCRKSSGAASAFRGAPIAVLALVAMGALGASVEAQAAESARGKTRSGVQARRRVDTLSFSRSSARPADQEAGVVEGGDFHGPRPQADVTLGLSLGLGFLDTQGGFNPVFSVAKKILHRGFIDSISNQAFVELQFGPNFVLGETAWFYSGHLRWDFRKDPEWTFFALGGFAGNFTGAGLGSRSTVQPRFGVGAFWTVSPQLTLRGDFSRELIAAGVSYGF